MRLGRTALSLCGLLAVAPAAAQSPARQLGVDTAGFDRSVRPQDDFNRFVNGRWEDHTSIPGDRSIWGSFNELDERTQSVLREIVERAAASGRGAEEKKVGDLYASYMDSSRVESRGLEPLRPELDRIQAMSSLMELPSVLARLLRLGVRGPFTASVEQDPRVSSAHIVSLSQADLALGDRAFYLSDGEAFAKLRSAYVAYLTRLFELADNPDPAAAAQQVLAFETSVAKVQWDRARNRDEEATYNKRTLRELQAMAPTISWGTFLAAGGMGQASEVLVRQPDYFEALSKIAAGTPVEVWREYLTSRLLDSYADDLPGAFGRARFDFRGRALTGVQVPQPRWKRGVLRVETGLGEALGKLYVERAFKPDAKARMDALVGNLLGAFRAGIEDLAWMSPPTRAEAQAKLAKFTVKIGYPERWRDYSGLEIRRNDLLGNVMRARAFQYDDMVRRLGSPVDRSRWDMTPQTVNAYYNSVNNEIVFPAAILQPPFFNVDADDAVNYGAIGAVIGHEISHGFDDQGRKSDGDGNLRDWWSRTDADAFEDQADRLVQQFETYVPVDDLHINGRLTLGENIGDLSGLAVAYRAYQMSLGGAEPPLIEGFTGGQRFFLGWAQVWRTKTRPEALRQRLLIDPHSPGVYRAFVPLTNLDSFYQAFELRQGDRMYRAPGERVKIW